MIAKALNRFWGYLCVFSLVVFSPGCAALLLGTGVVSGIMISNDSAELPVDKKPIAVFDASLEYLSSHGLVQDVDEQAMHIYAEKVFGKYYVQVDVKDNAGNSYLIVQARKTAKLLPDTEIAVKIAYDIAKSAGGD